MSRQGKLVKNTLLLSLGTLFPRVANIITLPILTAYLTKDEYGTYDLVTVLVTLYLPAITLQIQSAAFRFLIDERGDEDQIRSTITNIYAFTIPISVAGLLILWFFLPIDNKFKLLVCLYFIADILVRTTNQITRGLEKNLVYSISAIVGSFGNMVLDILFVWLLKMGMMGAVMALVISSALALIVNLSGVNLLSYIRLDRISWEKIKKMLHYSWPMVPNNMSMWVMKLSDRLVVTSVMGVAANAVYAVANKIPNMLNVAQAAFTFAWQENASIVSKDEDAGAYYSMMFRTLFNLMAGFLGLLICATPLFFVILIRGEYSEAYNQMPILFLAAFFYAMVTFLGGIYVAYMNTKSVAFTTTLAAACNLVVDIALIRQIGLYAASGSTLVSYLFLLIYRMVDIQKIVKIKYDIKNIISVSVILIIECVLCYLQKPFANIVNIILGTICFIVLNRAFIRAVCRKILKRK